MAANGYYVFKLKDTYYIYYNQWNSNFSSLGQRIVDELKTVDLDLMKEYVAYLCEDFINDYDGKEFESLMDSLEEPEDNDFVNILKLEPILELDINYIYIIDLDNNIFKVKFYDIEQNCCEKSFNAIPDDWIMFLEN